MIIIKSTWWFERFVFALKLSHEIIVLISLRNLMVFKSLLTSKRSEIFFLGGGGGGELPIFSVRSYGWPNA